MRFQELLRGLNADDFVIYDEANRDEEILGIKYQNEPTEEIAPDFLYFCEEKVFLQLKLSEKQRLSFAVWGCRDLHVTYGHVTGHHNIILIPAAVDGITVFNSLVEPFLREQKYAVSIKEMAAALFSNRGLQHLTDVAHSIFKKPVFLIDFSYRYLAKAFTKESFSPGTTLYNYLARGDAVQPFLDGKGIQFLKDNNLNEILARQDGPYRFYHDVFERQAITIGIRLKNVLVGQILMLECEMPFSEVDERLLIAFRDLVCQELQKDARYQNNRDDYASYLLLDLLTNKYEDEETIQRRLDTLGVARDDSMRVMVLQPRNRSAMPVSLEIVAAQLRQNLHNHIYAVIENCLVALLNDKNEKGPGEYFLEQVTRICENNQLVAGISNRFQSLTELDRQYRLAKRAALVGQKYLPDRSVVIYDDILDLAFLERGNRNNDLLDFVHSSVLELMEYDKRNGTDYLYTFWVYAECAFNAQQAAAKLFIHKNTLVYRVGKIREILRSNFSTGREQFCFQLSLRILKLLGMIPAPN